MAAVSTSLHQPESIPKIKDHMSETYDESNNSNASEPPDDGDHNQNRTSPKTSFSIQNVLNMKSERESPENVFATEQLLKNTPNFPYRQIMSPRTDEAEISDNFESPKHLERSSNYGSPQRNDTCSIPSPKTDERKSERSYSDNYSNPNSEINIDDEVSCCSEDTVLSVGNEAPIHSFSKNSDHNSQMSNPGLTSFKHIQTHLNAISQLSQNLSMNQPLLLRPNPLPANPLLFINQPLLFQNPMISPNHNKDLAQPNRLQPQINQFSLRNIKSQRNSVDENRIQHPSDYDEARREMMNQNCLKFSIDNILKADFGRRITDPLHKRKSSVKSRPVFESPKEVESPNKEQRVPEIDKTGEKSGAIDLTKEEKTKSSSDGPMVWPAWVYCTRYSDRPSSGPRTRRPKKPPGEAPSSEEKRPRTAFSGPQLARLKHEFAENRYLTERRRQSLAAELGLAEAQIKIWFQNKRAKIKKASGQRNPLALQLMAQGLYNHSTVPLSKEEEELEMKAREREKQLQSR